MEAPPILMAEYRRRVANPMKELWFMKRKSMLLSVSVTVAVAALATGVAISAQDKYTVKVPNGLAFSEFKGYENWAPVAVSQVDGGLKVIAANPAMIAAMPTA